MRLLVNWLIDAAALWFTAWLVPGISVAGTRALLLAALVIGLVNAVVKPVLVFLTFPVTILTLGIFYLILTGLRPERLRGRLPGGPGHVGRGPRAARRRPGRLEDRSECGADARRAIVAAPMELVRRLKGIDERAA